jgi:hypothetical protein
MFPSRDLPANANDNNIVPTESNSTKETKEKSKSLTSLCLLIHQWIFIFRRIFDNNIWSTV